MRFDEGREFGFKEDATELQEQIDLVVKVSPLATNKWYKVLKDMALGEISEYWIKSNSQQMDDFLDFFNEIDTPFFASWKDFDLLDSERK